MPTFAAPFEKRVSEKTMSSTKDWLRGEKKQKFSKKFGSLKIMLTFASPFEKRASQEGKDKFIEKTDYCTRSKYREIQFIEKR